MHRVTMRLSFAVAIIALAGCKPPADGQQQDLKALDEFAGGGARGAKCSATADGDASYATAMSQTPLFAGVISVQDAAKEVLVKKRIVTAASAVPSPVRQLFVRLGGRIIAAPDAADRCVKILTADENSRRALAGMSIPQSCLAVTGRGQTQESITILVPDTAQGIDTQLVRAFGYFLSQYGSRLFIKNGELELDAHANASFAKVRSGLAEAFLADMATSKTFDPAVFEPFFGPGSPDLIRANVAAKRSAYTQLPRLESLGDARAAAIDSFEGFVFAETFDSWFCNSWGPYDQVYAQSVLKSGGRFDAASGAKVANGRALLKDFFSRSYAAFGAVVPNIVRQVFNATVNLPAAKAGKGAGLSLLEGDEAVVTGAQALMTCGSDSGFIAGSAGDAATSIAFLPASADNNGLGGGVSALPAEGNTGGTAVDGLNGNRGNVAENGMGDFPSPGQGSVNGDLGQGGGPSDPGSNLPGGNGQNEAIPGGGAAPGPVDVSGLGVLLDFSFGGLQAGGNGTAPAVGGNAVTPPGGGVQTTGHGNGIADSLQALGQSSANDRLDIAVAKSNVDLFTPDILRQLAQNGQKAVNIIPVDGSTPSGGAAGSGTATGGAAPGGAANGGAANGGAANGGAANGGAATGGAQQGNLWGFSVGSLLNFKFGG